MSLPVPPGAAAAAQDVSPRIVIDQQRCTAMNAPPRAWRAAICSTGTRPARMGATYQQTPRPGCRDRQGLPASGGCARSRVVVPTARRRGERTVLTHHHLVAAQRQSHRPVATTFRRRGGGRRGAPQGRTGKRVAAPAAMSTVMVREDRRLIVAV